MSWLSKAIHGTANYVVGKGNPPGTPETRKYGYDRKEVADAVARQLQAPQAIGPANLTQQQMIVLGAAGVGALLLLRSSRKGR